MRRAPRETLRSLLLVLACVGLASSAWAASFSSKASNAGDTFAAAPDFRAPTVAATAVGKAEGGVAGFIHAGSVYRIYANVSDSGNPASGIAAVNSDLSVLSSGAAATPLSAGAFSFGGVAFNFRSASLTAKSALSAGTYGYTLTCGDIAANSATSTGLTVVVDNTSPNGIEVQTVNKTGGTAGRPELGDSIAFTYSEPIDPNSIVSGWSGSGPQNVVVHIDNNAASGGGNDLLSVWNATGSSALPLGSVDLGRKDYVTANATFGTTGTPSTIAQSINGFSITLGTASAGTSTAGGSGAMKWTPTSAAYDRAGNSASTATVTESGGSDREF